MFKDTHAFSSFSVDDIQKAKEFYGQRLGWKFPKRKKAWQCKSPAAVTYSYIPSRTINLPRSLCLIFPWTIFEEAVDKLAGLGVSLPADAKVIFKSQEAIALGKGYIATLGQWEQSFKGPDGKQQTIPFRTSEIIRKQGNTISTWSIMHRLGCHLHQRRHRAVHHPIRPSIRDTSLRRALLALGQIAGVIATSPCPPFCKACVTSSGSGVLERVALSTSTQIVSGVEMMASLPAMRNVNEVRPMCRAQTDTLCWGA